MIRNRREGEEQEKIYIYYYYFLIIFSLSLSLSLVFWRVCDWIELSTTILFASPLQVLGGDLVAYQNDVNMTDWFLAIPTTWDETVFLSVEFGAHLALAKRKGSLWVSKAKQSLELIIFFIILSHLQLQIKISYLSLLFPPSSLYTARVWSGSSSRLCQRRIYRSIWFWIFLRLICFQ